MLIAKYDYDTDIKVQRQEAREEGRVEGREEGREEGRAEGKESILIEQVKKKLARGESAIKIGKALEEDIKKIEEIIRSLQ